MWRHYNCAVYVRRRPTGSKLATIIIYVSQGKGVKMATRCCAIRSLPRKTKGGRTRGKGCVIYADETSAELESSFARKAKGSYPPLISYDIEIYSVRRLGIQSFLRSHRGNGPFLESMEGIAPSSDIPWKRVGSRSEDGM